MTIVVITNNSNGLYLFRRQLMSSLIEQGHEVIALTPFDSDIDSLRNLGVVMVETPIDRRGTNPIRDYSLMRLYKRTLKRIKPDLIITYTIKPNIYGGIVCRQLGISYSVNITGLGTAFEGAGILRKAAIILYKIALNKAKIVFFENSENRDLFVNVGIINKEKTHVLNGAGVDLDYFNYLPYPCNRDFRFLFIGRIMKEKGIDELLVSMKRLVSEGARCSLDVLGDLEEDYKDKLEIASSEGWLRYHGHQIDVRPYLKRCDCFVLPSYHEGMANTNLEAASIGRPIITTNIAGCKEAIVDGSGLLCLPKNEDSLFRAMKKMVLLTKEDREQMGKVGRKHMEYMFDKNKVVKETLEYLLK